MRVSSFFQYLGNLFGAGFEDKQLTIKEYRATAPYKDYAYILEDNSLKDSEKFEKLYNQAVSNIGIIRLEDTACAQDDYFHELTTDEGTIAVLLGIVAYALAREMDIYGKNMEAAIDKVLPKDYDTNNPFDTQQGYGHRVFGHDPIMMGVKNIPGNFLIHVKENGVEKYIEIAKFLGKDIHSNCSMWELVWKFYGNANSPLKGIANCLGHTIVHFAKDLLTPCGLPLPFVSLFEEYQQLEYYDASQLTYDNSVMQKLDKYELNLKASDFASFVLIETFLAFYCKKKEIENDSKGFKQDMKLIAIGTCVSLQMMTVINGKNLQIKSRKNGIKPPVPGGKVNVLLCSDLFIVAVKEMASVIGARREINKKYKTEAGWI